jgi:hypothetical protein
MKPANLFQINKQFIIGATLMFMPALFFFSVVMEQFFHNNFLIESIFVRIDKISGLLSALLMFGLPFIAICINAISFINFKMKKENENLVGYFIIKPRVLNVLVCLLGVMTIIIILSYLFVENYQLR